MTYMNQQWNQATRRTDVRVSTWKFQTTLDGNQVRVECEVAATKGEHPQALMSKVMLRSRNQEEHGGAWYLKIYHAEDWLNLISKKDGAALLRFLEKNHLLRWYVDEDPSSVVHDPHAFSLHNVLMHGKNQDGHWVMYVPTPSRYADLVHRHVWNQYGELCNYPFRLRKNQNVYLGHWRA